MGGADYALLEAAKYIGLEIDILQAYDFWDVAIDVYNYNFSHKARKLDITSLSVLPECDFVFGGPPCQPFSRAGKKLKSNDPRDMIPKTLELIKDKNYLIENVTTVFDAPYTYRLQSSNYGDCTIRRRTFHSNLSLENIPVLFPKTTIRDIRESAEDLRILKRRGNRHKAGKHDHYCDDDTLQSLTSESWHGHDVRGGKLLTLGKQDFIPEKFITPEEEQLGSLTSSSWRGTKNNGNGEPTKGTKVHLMPISTRGYSKNIRELTEEEPMTTLIGNMWHGTEDKYLEGRGCRNPSILEMQRAHSIPEDWKWEKTTKTDKGKLIANCWPIKMGISVWISFLMNFL